MKRLAKKGWSLLLVLTMLVGLFSVEVFGEGEERAVSEQTAGGSALVGILVLTEEDFLIYQELSATVYTDDTKSEILTDRSIDVYGLMPEDIEISAWPVNPVYAGYSVISAYEIRFDLGGEPWEPAEELAVFFEDEGTGFALYEGYDLAVFCESDACEIDEAVDGYVCFYADASGTYAVVAESEVQTLEVILFENETEAEQAVTRAQREIRGPMKAARVRQMAGEAPDTGKLPDVDIDGNGNGNGNENENEEIAISISGDLPAGAYAVGWPVEIGDTVSEDLGDGLSREAEVLCAYELALYGADGTPIETMESPVTVSLTSETLESRMQESNNAGIVPLDNQGRADLSSPMDFRGSQNTLSYTTDVLNGLALLYHWSYISRFMRIAFTPAEGLGLWEWSYVESRIAFQRLWYTDVIPGENQEVLEAAAMKVRDPRMTAHILITDLPGEGVFCLYGVTDEEGNLSELPLRENLQTGDLVEVPGDVYGFALIREAGDTVLRDGNSDYRVTVKYDYRTGIPAGDTRLEVVEIANGTEEYDVYFGQAADVLGILEEGRLFEIRIVDTITGEVYEPAEGTYADVLVELLGANYRAGAEAYLVHLGEEAEVLDVEVTRNGDDYGYHFRTGSFSPFLVGYTVDFYYDGYRYSIQGGDTVTLPEIFSDLHINVSMTEVDAVSFSDETLVTAEKDGEDWILRSLAPFDTEEKLTVTLTDGSTIEIVVLDEETTDPTPVCKITDSEGNLLLKRTASGEYVPAVYDTLQGAFDAVNAAGKLFHRSEDGETYIAVPETGVFQIQMLMGEYTLDSGITLKQNRTVILTTAGNSDTDGYPGPYNGGADPSRATITRGYSGNSLLTSSATKLVVKDLIFDGNRDAGYTGGIITISSGSLTIQGGTEMRNSLSVLDGGAVSAVSASGSVLIENNTETPIIFENCESPGAGGAIAAGGSLTINNQGAGIIFHHCSSGSTTSSSATNHGGAIYSAKVLVITGTKAHPVVFKNCYSSGNGGAVYIQNGSAKITYADFGELDNNGEVIQSSACISKNVGGAISGNGSTSPITLTDCNFYGCSSNGTNGNGGGAFSNKYGDLTLASTVEGGMSFVDCRSANGGGIRANTVTVQGNGKILFRNCAATTNGGGINASTFMIREEPQVTFDGCTATTNGGGIYTSSFTVNEGARVAIERCRAANGAGAYTTGAVTLNGGQDQWVTFTDCVATAFGGGLYVGTNSLSASLTNCSIEGCEAKQGAAVWINNKAKLYMNGGEITNNTATNGGAVQVGGIGARLYFAGDAQVTGNTMNGSASNVYLDKDSNEIINAGYAIDGETLRLSSGAQIGVYVTGSVNTENTNDPFYKHGREGAPFGTYGADPASGEKGDYWYFVNDRLSTPASGTTPEKLVRGTAKKETDTTNIMYWETADVTLTVVKTVTGEMGDPGYDFPFTLSGIAAGTQVSWTKQSKDPEDGIYKTLTTGGTGTATVDSNGRITFHLKHGQRIELKIPNGLNLALSENAPAGYKVWMQEDAAIEEREDMDSQQTSLTLENLSEDKTVYVLNKLEAVSPTGVSLPILPYILLLLIGSTLLALSIRRRGKDRTGNR